MNGTSPIFIFLMLLPLAGVAKPFGDPAAIRGGVLTIHSKEFPESFNLYINPSVDASDVFNLVYDSLLDLDPETLEFEPLIASSWTISPDKKTFTFRIDPRAKWADGVKVTAGDVKFTIDTIMNKSNLTSVQRISFSRFEEPVVEDDHTVVFKAKFVHFLNFANLASLNILPGHIYKGKDFNKSFNLALPCPSGPYALSEVKEGRYYILTRRTDYWGDILPARYHMYNFNRIEYKIIRDSSVAFEAFKKGEFDILTLTYDITPERWFTETSSEKFRKNWIIKQKIYNHLPRGFRGIALNMRKRIFQDVRVRQALFMLLDREMIINKIMYGFYRPLNSYWPSISDNKPIPYDPGKARDLLRLAGYDKLDSSGYLINGRGERLEFTILSRMDEEAEKYLTYYVQACRQAGVKVNLELTSWATLIKKSADYNFDALSIGFLTSLFDDPEQLWHSRHINDSMGSNFPGYHNRRVDALVDSLAFNFNHSDRNAIVARIDHIIYPEVPYLLTWDIDYFPVFYRNAFGKPKTALPKFGRLYSYDLNTEIISYWWYDPGKIKRLQEAMSSGKALDKEPEELRYDELAGKK
jgi:microcin C transport system substrate-binding protein